MERQKLLLCVTHSDRVTDLDRCSLNFLERRYDRPQQIPDLPPFESLPRSSAYSRYKGVVTLWAVAPDDWSTEHLATLRTVYKPQHALWYRDRLWILGTEVLEAYDADLACRGRVTDPWLADGHSVMPGPSGDLVLSCSASDAVLVVDPCTLAVTCALRLPEELYGSNYPLARTDSVVEHFIPNDVQLTHVNAAAAWRGGIVVSTLAQGAIGWFGPTGEYTEIVRGFVGCHGVRSDPRPERAGGLSFVDSTLGVIVFLDPDGKIDGRFSTRSAWLHDAVHLDGDVFALAVADRNVVEISDVRTKALLGTIDGSPFGQGPQFLSVSPLPAGFPEQIRRATQRRLDGAPALAHAHGATGPVLHGDPRSSAVRWGAIRAPAELRTGAKARVTATFVNQGSERWLAGGAQAATKLTYRWLGADDRVVSESGELWWLGQEVPPGGAVEEYPFDITAPQRAGAFWLELDLVRDGRCLGERGAVTARVPVAISRPVSGDGPPVVDLD